MDSVSAMSLVTLTVGTWSRLRAPPGVSQDWPAKSGPAHSPFKGFYIELRRSW